MNAQVQEDRVRTERLVLLGQAKWLDRISTAGAVTALVGLVFLAVLTLADIFLRAFSSYGVRGLFELNGLFMAIIIAGFMSLVFLSRRNIHVDVMRKLAGQNQLGVFLLATLSEAIVMVGFAVVLGFRAWDAYSYNETTTVIGFPTTALWFIACVLIAAQIPIGISLALLGMASLGLTLGIESAFILAQNEVSHALTSIDMAAIPLFLLMGNFATWAGLSGDIFKAGAAVVGSRRGGLVIASVMGCGGFGAICGSSIATTATFGKVAFAEMEKRNYAQSLAAGCIAAGGTLGALIPPSVVLIVYCIVVEASIQVAFQAALIPGLLALGMYILAIMITVRIKPELAPTVEEFDWVVARKALIQAWRPTILFILVLGGLYGGFFTTQEAASVGAILALLFAVCSPEFTKQKFVVSLIDTALNAGAIYVIFIGANIFASFMSFSDVASLILDFINIETTPHWLILFALVIFYLLLGTIFDTLAAILVTTPLVIPLIIGMDYDLVWWGVVTLSLVEIGMITPPLGMNVFVMRSVVGDRLPLATIFRGVVPFLAADLVRIILLVVFPAITLWLPSVLK